MLYIVKYRWPNGNEDFRLLRHKLAKPTIYGKPVIGIAEVNENDLVFTPQKTAEESQANAKQAQPQIENFRCAPGHWWKQG